MAEKIVNKHIILGIAYEKNTRKMPTKSIKMKISKTGLRYVLSWFKVGLEPKFGQDDKSAGN